MMAASMETMLELWALSLRDVKARIRPLFTQARVTALAGLFVDGLLGPERRKTGWMRAEAAGDGSVKNLGRYAASWIAGWPNRPSSTAALTWSTRWAPRGDQRICWRLFMRALTSWLTVPSAR